MDHDSPRKKVIERLSDRLGPNVRTEDLLGWPTNTTETITLGDGQAAPFFRIGNEVIIAQTDLPGHTVIGSCFLLGKSHDQQTLNPHEVRFAFSGDTILIGGIGRTDFSASSEKAMFNSLQKLPKLISPTTAICPTHDYENDFTTTLEAETKNNPFLAKICDTILPISYDEYSAEKQRLDSGIQDESNSELVCGMICSANKESSSIDVRPDELADFFAEHQDALVVDVREPQEFQFVRDWQSFGLKNPPLNVPLSHFTNFLSHQLREKDHHREIIFLCRSGTRSGKAAQTLRRLGNFSRAWNIAGGIALGSTGNQAKEEAEYMI